MKSPTHDGITLGDLPSDIIRTIMKMELESIDEIRMISDRWDGVFKSVRKNLPVITRFSWEICLGITGRPFSKPSVYIANSNRKFFGIDNWPFFTNITKGGKFGNLFAKSDCERMSNDLTKLFGRCSYVETLEIHYKACELFYEIKETLRDVTVNELRLRDLRSIDATLAKTFRDLIIAHSVKMVNMTFISSTVWDAVKSELTELLKLCASLQTTVSMNIDYTDEATDWQARMNDLNVDGNLSLKLILDKCRVYIVMTANKSE